MLMNELMKINAVKTLMQSLNFTAEEKKALWQDIGQELGQPQTDVPVNKVVEFGNKQYFEMLFADGGRSFYQRKGEKPVGVIINTGFRHFALYTRQHDYPQGTDKQRAKCVAENCLPLINGKSWRLISTEDCRRINYQDIFRALNRQLSTIGAWRQLPESRTVGVLCSDETPVLGNTYQIWFVLDV